MPAGEAEEVRKLVQAISGAVIVVLSFIVDVRIGAATSVVIVVIDLPSAKRRDGCEVARRAVVIVVIAQDKLAGLGAEMTSCG